MEQEIWKELNDYQYDVSNLGNIRRRNKKVYLKKRYCKRGYIRAALCKNGVCKNFYVHRLVAELFIPNIFYKKEVNHIDGVKTNNNINNLEWVTPSENVKHAFFIGLQNNSCENSNRTKLTNNDIIDIRNSYNKKNNQNVLAKKYNVTQTCISDILRYKTWIF